jgi:exosortase A
MRVNAMRADPEFETQLKASSGFNWNLYRVPVLVSFIVLALALSYFSSTREMVKIWDSSETFAHGFLIFPIFVYLLWRERAALAQFEIRPCAPALLGIALMGFGWLLGELASTSSPSQFALVGMIAFSVWAALGTRLFRALLVPLAFLLFAVPFGEFMLPQLMQWTADFTVAALRASGVPVYREGLQFVIPTGRWSVIEACGGLRYLIASLMVGCLYGWLTYRSARRRWAFVAVSIIVPLIANWLRAYMIVMIGHLSGNRLATGVDHLIYGWLFFGLVMLIVFSIGARWREDIDKPNAITFTAQQQRGTLPRSALLTLVAAFAVALMWRPLAHALTAPQEARIELSAPQAAAGWQAQSHAFIDWRPDYQQPDSEERLAFAKGDRSVGLYIAYYRNQSQGHELINTTNQLVRSRNPDFSRVQWGSRPVDFDKRHFSADTGTVRSGARHFVFWHWYWIDGYLTSNTYAAKVALAWARLRGRGDDSAAIVVYAPQQNGAQVLEEFMRDMGPQIMRSLAAAGAQ